MKPLKPIYSVITGGSYPYCKMTQFEWENHGCIIMSFPTNNIPIFTAFLSNGNKTTLSKFRQNAKVESDLFYKNK